METIRKQKYGALAHISLVRNSHMSISLPATCPRGTVVIFVFTLNKIGPANLSNQKVIGPLTQRPFGGGACAETGSELLTQRAVFICFVAHSS